MYRNFQILGEILGRKTKGADAFIKANHAAKDDIERAYKYTQASVSLVDKAVGKIINKLKADNLYDDTIIIFTADHGRCLVIMKPFIKRISLFTA